MEPVYSPESSEISRFSEFAESTSIYLLNAIERTVNGLASYQKLAEVVTSEANRLFDDLVTIERQIDEDGSVQGHLLRAEEAIARIVQNMALRQENARRDPSLTGDHEQRVIEEFARTIETFVEAQHALCDARWALMEHDADWDDKVSEAFEDFGSLMDSLKSN